MLQPLDRHVAPKQACTHRLRHQLTAVACALLGREAVAQPVGAVGTVSGSVADTLGSNVVGAIVSIEGQRRLVQTDADGSFRLDGVHSGRIRLHVRRLGFFPETATVAIAPGGASAISIRLRPLPQRLVPVVVTARREVYESRLSGYNLRRSRRIGYFLTRDRIEQSANHRFTDLLRAVPGVSFRTVRGGPTHGVRLRGSPCAPIVFIDGFPAAAAEFDLDMIDLASVEGVEIYGGLASVPSEFITARGLERCGVIAVWSRPARPRVSLEQRADLPRLVDRRAVATEAEVDDPASPVRALEATYPDSLLRGQHPGRAVLEFVVDTNGAIEAETIGVVSATHPDFALAARAALIDARFGPALRAGERVRQLVQLTFIFDPRHRRGSPVSALPRSEVSTAGDRPVLSALTSVSHHHLKGVRDPATDPLSSRRMTTHPDR